MHQLELLIVIINYKTEAMTKDCIQSILPQLSNSQEIVIVDNNSQDGSAEALQVWIQDNELQLRISLICSSVNLGFSGGNNLGIQHKEAKYYLLLNSDTLLHDGALKNLLASAGNTKEIGMVSPRLEWPDGTPQISCFKFQTPITEFIHSASLSVFTRILARWNIPIDVQESPSSPQWTSFACILIKRELIDDVGLMDEGYFLYYEDVDYCKLAADKGWKILNTPKSRVIHLRGGSSVVKENQSKKKRVPKYVYESRARYYAKHYGRAGLLTANILWALGRTISYSLELLGRKRKATCEKEYLDIWTNTLSPMKPSRFQKNAQR